MRQPTKHMRRKGERKPIALVAEVIKADTPYSNGGKPVLVDELFEREGVIMVRIGPGVMPASEFLVEYKEVEAV